MKIVQSVSFKEYHKKKLTEDNIQTSRKQNLILFDLITHSSTKTRAIYQKMHRRHLTQ